MLLPGCLASGCSPLDGDRSSIWCWNMTRLAPPRRREQVLSSRQARNDETGALFSRAAYLAWRPARHHTWRTVSLRRAKNAKGHLLDKLANPSEAVGGLGFAAPTLFPDDKGLDVSWESLKQP